MLQFLQDITPSGSRGDQLDFGVRLLCGAQSAGAPEKAGIFSTIRHYSEKLPCRMVPFSFMFRARDGTLLDRRVKLSNT